MALKEGHRGDFRAEMLGPFSTCHPEGSHGGTQSITVCWRKEEQREVLAWEDEVMEEVYWALIESYCVQVLGCYWEQVEIWACPH